MLFMAESMLFVTESMLFVITTVLFVSLRVVGRDERRRGAGKRVAGTASTLLSLLEKRRSVAEKPRRNALLMVDATSTLCSLAMTVLSRALHKVGVSKTIHSIREIVLSLFHQACAGRDGNDGVLKGYLLSAPWGSARN